MCVDYRKVLEVRSGVFTDNGTPAVVTKPAKRPPVHPDGFYVTGHDRETLTGPFPTNGAASSHRDAIAA